MKYYNYQITTSEIPDEITLCINITGCPIHCADCHSKFLWEDTGEELTEVGLYKLLNKNPGISCVCIMGGDGDYEGLHQLFDWIGKWKKVRTVVLKTALYSGRNTVQDLLDRAGTWIKNIDYIKVGPYIKELGPINVKSTNQKLFKISPFSSWCLAVKKDGDSLERVCGSDITYKFWK